MSPETPSSNPRPADPQTASAGDSRSIHESAAHLLALLDGLPIHVTCKDLDGRITFVNRAFADLVDKSVDDLMGKTDYDLFPAELADKYRQDDQRVIESGELFTDIEENESGGEMRYFEVRKSPTRNPDGEICGTQAVFWEVTQQKAIEAALDNERFLLNTLLDNAPDSIYFKDKESRFIRIGRGLAERFGLADAREAVGKTDADFFTEEHARPAREDELQVMETGRPILAKIEKETWGEGRETWCSTTKLPLRDAHGVIVGTFGVTRDITNLIKIEEELREARDAADAANKAKSDFLANMSHEIRTPMNAIIGMTDLVIDTELTQAQREYLDMVKESGEALLELINEILDFSKIEAGKLELDRTVFNLGESLGDTMKSLALRAHAKDLELAYAIDPSVPAFLAGDLSRIRQVVINLVGNAIKFTESGEVVLEVSAEPVADRSVKLHFAVSDTGIGIEPHKCDKIFEAFQQADTSTTRSHGGTGLGLAISTRLVELMDGSIWVESTVGQGSCFHFTTRCEIAEEGEESKDPSPTVTIDAPVMVVDDNSTNRRILREMLTNWGMKPTMASGAKIGLQLLNDAVEDGQPFRLVVSDVNMPEVDGFTFVEWIRELPDLKDTPVIMLTSGGRPGDVARREQLKISCSLLKPAKQSELFDSIAVALGVNAPEGEVVCSAEEAALPDLPPQKVLLAEDNAVNQKLVVGLLEPRGHQVTVACNGQEAVSAALSEEFDVILMDVQMPVLDGFEATRLIREGEQGSGKRVPIIAMTAHALKGDRERCLEAGMDDYLAKPIRIRTVTAKLAEVLASESGRAAPSRPATEKKPGAAKGSRSAEPRPIDWSDALKIVDGDESLLRSLVQVCLEDFPVLMVQVRISVEAGDAVALNRAAHALKGAMLVLGSVPASDYARDLEGMAAKEDLGHAEEILGSLEIGVNALCDALQKYLES